MPSATDNAMRVVIASEDHPTRAFLAENLRADGYAVTCAADVDQAEIALADAPHVAICDLNGSTLALLNVVRDTTPPARVDPAHHRGQQPRARLHQARAAARRRAVATAGLS